MARDVGGITELVKALKHIVVGIFFKDHQIGESIVERFKEHLRVCGSGDDGRYVDVGKAVTVQVRELVIGHYGVEQLLGGLRQGMYFVDKYDGASGLKDMEHILFRIYGRAVDGSILTVRVVVCRSDGLGKDIGQRGFTLASGGYKECMWEFAETFLCIHEHILEHITDKGLSDEIGEIDVISFSVIHNDLLICVKTVDFVKTLFYQDVLGLR